MHFDAVVFPGQGTQVLGMGKDFVESYREAREVFALASDAVGLDLYEICQNNEEQLNSTQYTQPCILAVEMAIFAVLQQYFNFKPQFFAGHSLGEYAALVASKVIPLEIAIQIVHFRGKLMHSAGSPDKPAGMVAVITDPLPLASIRELAATNGVDIANDNSKQQVVLSGYNKDLEQTINQIEELLAPQPVRFVALAVNAAFHSRYMQPLEVQFFEYISDFKQYFATQNLPKVISNYFGDFYPNNIDALIEGLTKQISGSVKWRDNMEKLISHTKNIIELGSATPLRGFFKTAGIMIPAITNIKSINKVFAHGIYS